MQVQGRVAKPIAAGLAGCRSPARWRRLPRARGHLLRGRQVAWRWSTARPAAGRWIWRRSDDEPPLLAPVSARRWPIGDLLLWEQLEWEGEAEETGAPGAGGSGGPGGGEGRSRRRCGRPSPSAAVEAASRALDIAAQPGEVKRWVGEIADQGQPRAEVALRALAGERARWRTAGVRCAPAGAGRCPRSTWRPRSRRRCGRRAPADLSLRRLGGGTVEVRWLFQGQRLISLVAEQGLRVIDSGVCLSGEDDLVTLDSLPGVIREAMDDDVLVITRHE